MVYLTILLTILISILVYTFDPAPNRSKHDITAAEAYVLGFVNQHQAARDFMKHWMGHSAANTGLGVILSGDGDADNLGRMESFTSYGLSTKDNIRLGDVGRGFGVGASGTFKSAYLCLDSNEDLASENVATCKSRYVVTYSRVDDALSGRPSWWAEKESSATTKQRWRRAITQRTRGSYGCGVLVKSLNGRHWCFQPGKKNSVVASASACVGPGWRQGDYCIDNGEGCKSVLPEGVKDFLQIELGGGNVDLDDMLVCVSSVKNPYITDGLIFQYDGIDNSGRGAPASSMSDADFVGNTRYRKVVTGANAGASWQNLAIYNLFSPITLVGAKWENNASAPKVNESNKLVKSTIENGAPAVIPNASSGSQLGDHAGLQPLGRDSYFTLTVVAQVPQKVGGTQAIIGPVYWNGDPSLDIPVVGGNPTHTHIALVYRGGACKVSNGANVYESNFNETGWDCFMLLTRGYDNHNNPITEGHAVRYFISGEHTNDTYSLNNQIMSWTIVKRPKRTSDGKKWDSGSSVITWYNGSAPVCTGVNMDDIVKPDYNEVAGVSSPMTLGGGNGVAADAAVRIYAVRYYDRPLTRREIHHNFLVDAKRYGLGRWDGSGSRFGYYGNDGDYLCTLKCEVDSDCLNTYETCQGGSCVASDTSGSGQLNEKYCTSNSQCGSNEFCRIGKCVKR